MTRQPTYYIPHGGGPCFFMDDPYHLWTHTGNFLHHFPRLLTKPPKAILMISSHWESDPVSINHQSHPALYYDYYDFPEPTYHLDYPASGDPILAERIKQLLSVRKIHARLEANRGWDHGVFIPLKLMFPKADFPVVELSLHSGLDPSHHLQIGKALSTLRDENILILGSGMSYHNLPALFSGTEQDKAMAFNQWLITTVTDPMPSKRNQRLACWTQAPGAISSHPRPEHLLPLLVVAGAADTDQGHCIFKGRILNKPINAFQFG